MSDFERARERALRLAELIKSRTETRITSDILSYSEPLKYSQEEMAISPSAWARIEETGTDARLVFAHPELLRALPHTSSHYRGIALLSQKSVGRLASNIANWERGSIKRSIRWDTALKVARLYNAVISSIIENSSDWVLENGYRNIIANIGIRLDGMYRNKIGELAETMIKDRIVNWLRKNKLIVGKEAADRYGLRNGVIMQFGSEPDIVFLRKNQMLATIEIKGGTDRAGALERLGAMLKSFAETPPGCTNFLIAGVVTKEMQHRLDQIGSVKVFELDLLVKDQEEWARFTREIFHYDLRINGIV